MSIKEEDTTFFPKEMDYSLFEATMEAYSTNSIMPILKEELKLKIQTTRLAAGKAELPTPIFKEPEKNELTAEEKRRREIRKESNRIAAAKCRNRRKTREENTKTKLAELELRNYTLKQKLEDLLKEKAEVLKKLRQIGTLTNIFPSLQMPPSHAPSSNASVSRDVHQNENITHEPFKNHSPMPVTNAAHVESNEVNIASIDDFIGYTDMVASEEVRSFDEMPNKEMEFVNWVPPEPQPCTSSYNMWTDDFFDEVDGDLLNMDSQTVTDKFDNEPQNSPRYVLPLIPVFDDEATVPGNVDNPSFDGRITPTSPTFY
ncbi:hypothetical protein ACF0H5_003199 [Mactra antiquata]